MAYVVVFNFLFRLWAKQIENWLTIGQLVDQNLVNYRMSFLKHPLIVISFEALVSPTYTNIQRP